MKIRTKTTDQGRKDREAWKPVFALLPAKVNDGDWRWLEMVEIREITQVVNRVAITTVQRRAPGSENFWPPFPFKTGEAPIVERRSNRARLDYPGITPEPRIERAQQTEK